MKPFYQLNVINTRAARLGKSHRRATMLATSAMLSFAALGCGGDGLLAPGLGSGSVTATGAVSASGSGLAVFQSASSGGTSLFQIVIAPITQSAAVWELQIANYTGRLAVGTYDLSPLSASSSDPTANFYYTSNATMQMFNSTSGQLVITSSSQSEVRGTFTFTATDASGGTGTVSVQGSFTAQCAPGTVCQ
ncbi:MAG: DUF6252 family protein [Gemmatimonadaceae bacterium]